jgi:predicted DNA-binding helix-hairpin-helix protein
MVADYIYFLTNDHNRRSCITFHVRPPEIPKTQNYLRSEWLTGCVHMFYNRGMESLIKLEEIALHMDLEPAEETATVAGLAQAVSPYPTPVKVAPCGQVTGRAPAGPTPTYINGQPQAAPRRLSRQEAKQQALGIFQATISGNRTIPLLKTMLTTACERNCYYCPFRAGRNYQRVTFQPEEMAEAFMRLYRAGMVRGLFLSSGIIGGGLRTQERLLDTVTILRQKQRFTGYIHLKIMPGAEQAQVETAAVLADRLSINLEAPNEGRLQAIAPKKQFAEELVRPLQWLAQYRTARPHLRHASATTQFVVGTGETDLELLATAAYLHQQLKLARTYYSAFRPIPDTPLEHLPPENPLRQHRLYQASFLFRDYGFDLEEMPFTQLGYLPLDTDPKQAWAQLNLLHNPVEVNQADRELLLRVPGIGPKGANAILSARRRGTLSDLSHLRAIGVETKRPSAYLLLDGKRPLRQLSLW